MENKLPEVTIRVDQFVQAEKTLYERVPEAQKCQGIEDPGERFICLVDFVGLKEAAAETDTEIQSEVEEDGI